VIVQCSAYVNTDFVIRIYWFKNTEELLLFECFRYGSIQVCLILDGYVISAIK